MKKLESIIGIILASLLIALLFLCLFWTIYAFAKYGGYSINEIPSWALFFMWRR